jgi:hypothetical protein
MGSKTKESLKKEDNMDKEYSFAETLNPYISWNNSSLENNL